MQAYDRCMLLLGNHSFSYWYLSHGVGNAFVCVSIGVCSLVIWRNKTDFITNNVTLIPSSGTAMIQTMNNLTWYICHRSSQWNTGILIWPGCHRGFGYGWISQITRFMGPTWGPSGADRDWDVSCIMTAIIFTSFHIVTYMNIYRSANGSIRMVRHMESNSTISFLHIHVYLPRCPFYTLNPIQ